MHAPEGQGDTKGQDSAGCYSVAQGRVRRIREIILVCTDNDALTIAIDLQRLGARECAIVARDDVVRSLGGFTHRGRA